MLKKLLVGLIFLLTPYLYAQQDVFQGEFGDGSKVLWSCGKAEGQVRFMFITKEGVPYQGVLSCGKGV